MKRISLLTVVAIVNMTTLMAQQKNAGSWNRKPGSIETRWAAAVNPDNVLPEYPRPQLVRGNWTNLNGLWQYAITNRNAKAPAKFQGNILVPFPLESSLSGVQKNLQPDEVLWYKTNFTRPLLEKNHQLLLHFGAVNWETTIYVNGKEVGRHTGGYTAFNIDISAFVKPGKNELVVKAWNPLEKGIGPRGKQTLTPTQIFYTASSGIWQTVWLESVPRNYIKDLRINPEIDSKSVKIIVNSTFTAPVKIAVDGQTIDGQTNREMVIPIRDVKLWSPDAPFLYDIRVTMGSDQVKSYFGMRKVEVRKDEKGIDRLFLNNKYYYQFGTLDQGYWPDGLYTAPADEALQFDIAVIKAMGFNTIRKHIKLEPARWYYHADKMGVLVWQDLVQPSVSFNAPPSEAAKTQFEKESAEIINQFSHFPCLSTWVVFNENWGAYDQQRVTEWVKARTPGRLVNGHSGAMIVNRVLDENNAKEVTKKSAGSDMTDIHSYPPPGMPNALDGKARVLGEFGGIAVSVEGHLWSELFAGFGYGDVQTPKGMLTIYGEMSDSLHVYEQQGLSASIYTQPFDVENEQNGLITYDRHFIKAPMEAIRNINSRVWPATKNWETVAKGLNIQLVPDELASDFPTRYDKYKNLYLSGNRDSLVLLRLAVLAQKQKDPETSTAAAQEYIRRVKDPLRNDNLLFQTRYTTSIKDPGFSNLFRNKMRVPSSLREHVNNALERAIYNSEIKPLVPDEKAMPNWDSLEKAMLTRYQEPGERIFLRAKAIHMMNQKNYPALIATMDKQFKKYPSTISAGAVNDQAWLVFEEVNDKALLEKVASWMEPTIGQVGQANIIDTYANVIYKIGRKKEALQWYAKVVSLDPNDSMFAETFEKMKKGLPTWPQHK